jgi:hypothetical protein
MPDKTADVYKALAVMDDTTKVDPMKVLDGLSDNWRTTDTVAQTVQPTKEPFISNPDHPAYALLEVGVVIALFFLSSFSFSK